MKLEPIDIALPTAFPTPPAARCTNMSEGYRIRLNLCIDSVDRIIPDDVIRFDRAVSGAVEPDYPNRALIQECDLHETHWLQKLAHPYPLAQHRADMTWFIHVHYGRPIITAKLHQQVDGYDDYSRALECYRPYAEKFCKDVLIPAQQLKASQRSIISTAVVSGLAFAFGLWGWGQIDNPTLPLTTMAFAAGGLFTSYLWTMDACVADTNIRTNEAELWRNSRTEFEELRSKHINFLNSLTRHQKTIGIELG